MSPTIRVAAFLILTPIAAVAIAWCATRLLGTRRSWVANVTSGVVGWLLGNLLAYTAAGGDLSAPGLVRNGLVFSFLAIMVVAVVLDLLAPPGTLAKGDAAGRFVVPHPIGDLRRRARRMRRYVEIVGILRSTGLAPHLGIRPRRKGAVRQPVPVRVRVAMERAGGMFVKLGQVASTRTDLLPRDYCQELAKLQSSVPPADPDEIRALLEIELRAPVDEVFAEFDWEPVAAASIGQAHQARLRSGEEVIVKVQRPGIEELVRQDVDVLLRLARTVQDRTPWGSDYAVYDLAQDFTATLLEELDFRIEARNAVAVAANLRPGSGVRVPAVYEDYSTSRVMVQERFAGVSALHAEVLDSLGYDRQELARRLLAAVLEQMFVDGLFHADPHPGNVLILDHGDLGLIDWGAVGQIDPLQQAALRDMVIAIGTRDAALLTASVAQVATLPPDVDEQALERALSRMMVNVFGPRGGLSAAAFNDLTRILSDFGIRLPGGLTSLFRALVTLEGTLSTLAPGFDLAEAAPRIAGEVVTGRASDDATFEEIARQELISLLPVLRRLPRHTDRVISQLQRGELGIRVSLFASERDTRFVATMVNRMVLAFLGAVLGVASALLLANTSGQPFSGDTSLVQFFGAFGMISSAVLILRVVAAVVRDGPN